MPRGWEISAGNVNHQDKNGRTPLLLAAAKGHKDIVKLLLKVDEIDITRQDKKGRTPLSRAEFKGHHDIVRILLIVGWVQGVDSEPEG